MSYTLAIQPLYYDTTVFALGTGVSVSDLLGRQVTHSYDGSEVVEPYESQFEPGDVVQLIASQNKYSFDYFEIWSPNTVHTSTSFYVTAYGFTASYDPRTKVILNNTGSIIGTNEGNRYGIVARYR